MAVSYWRERKMSIRAKKKFTPQAGIPA